MTNLRSRLSSLERLLGADPRGFCPECAGRLARLGERMRDAEFMREPIDYLSALDDLRPGGRSKPLPTCGTCGADYDPSSPIVTLAVDYYSQMGVTVTDDDHQTSVVDDYGYDDGNDIINITTEAQEGD